MNKKRGQFIALCGLDASGKSCVQTAINNAFKDSSRKLINIKHPPKGWMDNPSILDTFRKDGPAKISDIDEIKYTTELRIKEQNETILPELEKGSIVLAHRYIYSLYTFYHARATVDLQEIFRITNYIILPDVTIYLKISPEESIKRLRNRSEKLVPYQQDINYVSRMAEYYERLGDMFDFQVVDTERNSIEDTTKQCMEIISNMESNNKRMTVGDRLKLLNM